MHLANYGSYYLAMYVNITVNLGDYYAHELVWWGNPFAQCYTNGHVPEVEQAPFAPAIVRYYLMAILSIEHDLSQKLDLEAVATVAIYS